MTTTTTDTETPAPPADRLADLRAAVEAAHRAAADELAREDRRAFDSATRLMGWWPPGDPTEPADLSDDGGRWDAAGGLWDYLRAVAADVWARVRGE